MDLTDFHDWETADERVGAFFDHLPPLTPEQAHLLTAAHTQAA